MVITGIAAMALAVPSCATGVRRDPDQSSARYQLGVEYFSGRRVEAAIEELNQAIKADPENADAHHLLGLIALSQGHDHLIQVEGSDCLKGRDAEMVREDAIRRFREAEAHVRRALAIRPEFPEAWNSLSVALIHLQDWDGSIAAAGRALKDATYPQPEVARANLGWAYYQKRDLQRAWKELHEAVTRAPGFCVGNFRLAKVFVDRGDIEQAKVYADAVIDNPRCPIQEAFLLGGLIHQRRKDAERAKTLFDRCAAMAPRSCSAGECRRYAQMLH